MLIDTHCHINLMIKSAFDTILLPSDYQLAQEIIDQAKKEMVLKIFTIGTSIIESENCLSLAQRFKEVYAVLGIHPNDLTPDWKSDIEILKKLTRDPQTKKIIAIGECGLDFHYPGYNREQQYSGFKAQIELALEHNLPLVIHTRDASDETLRCIESFKDSRLKGVIHCFSEELAFAQDAIKLGFMLGIGGTITYPKNDILRQVLKTIGLNNIILETDAPYLPPQQLRGTKNSPKNIRIIADYIAELVEQDPKVVYDTTTQNVYKLFGTL